MYTFYKNNLGWAVALLILASFILTGCQSTESFYRGYQAQNDSISQLSTDGTQQGYWKTFDIDMSYQYDYADNVLNISGALALGLYYEMNISRIKSMDIFLFFLDDESKVLQTAYISRSMINWPDEGLLFTKSINVPAGAKAIAFGYRGKALGDDGGGDEGLGGGGGMEFFSDLPKRP